MIQKHCSRTGSLPVESPGICSLSMISSTPHIAGQIPQILILLSPAEKRLSIKRMKGTDSGGACEGILSGQGGDLLG